ncbi:uncharacterized protein LOC130054993 [Ostrea edulis]|uniref:uncharacterized protein LOC130054993 n=1 Tax=Ostrea edulis TaxID=37623 RepID=UPI0024AFDEC1|nr:uncharacterized protein LOC130054993 [Ostrea edulis]
MKTLQNKLESLEKRVQANSSSESVPGRRRFANKRKDGKVKCYYCSEEGHIRRQCPKLKKENSDDSKRSDKPTDGSARRIHCRKRRKPRKVSKGNIGANSLCEEADKPSLEESKQIITSASDSRLCQFGKGNFAVKVGKSKENVEVVVADITVDGILGLDFLKTCNGAIDFETSSLKLNNENCHFSWEGTLSCYRVTANSDICIPPRSKVVVMAKVPGENTFGCADYLVEAESKFLESGRALVGCTLVKGHDLVPVCLMNITDNIQQIHDCTLIAKMTAVEEQKAHVGEVPRRIPLHLSQEVDKQVNEMIGKGVIEPSVSPWASPVVLVHKTNGTMRFCVEYCRLNEVTVKDAYPLPKIDEAFDHLSGHAVFSTLDLSSGYWQVDMEEADKEKTVFVTRKGLYQFKVMHFGLCSAPATFERLMETVLAGLQWNKYLDGIAADPEKVKAVADWPVPRNVSDIRSFIGIRSYYRRFIRDIAFIAKSLHRLNEKGRKFQWTKETQEAFETLRDRLISAPILALSDVTKQFILDTDASGTSIGAVLSQKIDDKERVIAYASQTLTKAERRYCVTMREVLAIVHFLKHSRPCPVKAFYIPSDLGCSNLMLCFWFCDMQRHERTRYGGSTGLVPGESDSEQEWETLDLGNLSDVLGNSNLLQAIPVIPEVTRRKPTRPLPVYVPRAKAIVGPDTMAPTAPSPFVTPMIYVREREANDATTLPSSLRDCATQSAQATVDASTQTIPLTRIEAAIQTESTKKRRLDRIQKTYQVGGQSVIEIHEDVKGER